jgi:hypothetical protein
LWDDLAAEWCKSFAEEKQIPRCARDDRLNR